MAKNEQTQEQASAAAPSPPPPPAPESKKIERQSFVAIFNIVDGDKTYTPGESAKLTREQFDALKPLGAIEGDWKQ